MSNYFFISQATLCLHNFLRTEEMKLDPTSQHYCPPGYTDSEDQDNGEWRAEGRAEAFRNFDTSRIHNAYKNAKQMRDSLTDYFVGLGAVPW